MVTEVLPRYVSPLPTLQSNFKNRISQQANRPDRRDLDQTSERTPLWLDGVLGSGSMGLGGSGGRWSSCVCGAFVQVAVLPANSWVGSVTPGSSVSIRVPAKIPPEIPVGQRKGGM